MSNLKPYKLMTSMFAHTGDVKSLCPTRDYGGFVSVSRDLSAKLWKPSSENSNLYSLSQTINVHKKFVNAVVVVYTLEEYPNGLIITGSNDQTIVVHNIESNEMIAQLHEHDGAVCTLSFNSESNLLYSGSFDSTAKVWKLNDLVPSDFKLKASITVKGHDHTVWSVLGIDKQGVLLTASADKTIKHWQLNSKNTDAELVCKYAGHTDCVRGLALNNLNNQEFFSCSNDGQVLQWKLAYSTPLRSIRVTDSFLYSINMLNLRDDQSCYFLTSGEDRTLRIHSIIKNQVSCVQSIALPSQTLWYTVCLPNGNIAVACSDGSIRLFTQSEQLMANKTEIEEYERELSQFVIPIKSNDTLSQINRTELPGVEALTIPGKKDGQTLMVNNDKEIEVYQWDVSESKWIKIGVAVGSSEGAAGANQKVTYLGKEYDYVFDIELDDTQSKLKLPYNLSEDPYHVAQAFIHRHELDQSFLDQIAHFIIKNTQSETIGRVDASSTASTYFDPFTGEGRYVPPSNGSAAPRYTSSYQTYGAADPFTGSNAYHTSSNRGSNENKTKDTNTDGPQSINSNEFYPYFNFILFDQSKPELIIKKLKEFQQQIASSHQNELITDNNNIELIEHLILNCENVESSSGQLNDQIELLFQMIEIWPQDKVFPLLDLTRIVILNKSIAHYVCRNQNTSYLTTKQAHPNSNKYFESLFKLVDPNNIVCSMLVIKIFCNLFKTINNDIKSANNQKILAFLLNERIFLMKRLELFMNTDNKSFQIAFATLIINYVVLYSKLSDLKDKFSNDFLNESNQELIEYLNDASLCDHLLDWDGESLFRLLVSYGTLLSDSNMHLDTTYLRAIATSLNNFKNVCEKIKAKSQKYPEKLTKCVSYLIKLLN